MLKGSRITSTVASAVLLLASGASAKARCKKDEQPLEFRFFTDNNSWKDNGWVLECDYEDAYGNESKELVWETAIGSIKVKDHTEILREAACIPDTATCYLNIFDAKGDGLQGSQNDDPDTSFSGFFTFVHGATTIATSENLESPEFNELSYCVGPKCDMEPLETNDDCENFAYLSMQLDNSPKDTSYQLVCVAEQDDVGFDKTIGFKKTIVWDGKGFKEPGAHIDEETCLPKDACCEFIVVDSKSNGLTDAVDVGSDVKPRSGKQSKGYIYLELNNKPVLEYDGNVGETFSVLTHKLGKCAASEDEAPTKATPKEDKKGKDTPKDEHVEGVTLPEEDIEEESVDEKPEKPEKKKPTEFIDYYANADDDAKFDFTSMEDDSFGTSEPSDFSSTIPPSLDFSEDSPITVGNNVHGVFDPNKPVDYYADANDDTKFGTWPTTDFDYQDDYQNMEDDGKHFGQDGYGVGYDYGGDVMEDDVSFDEDYTSYMKNEEEILQEMQNLQDLINSLDDNTNKLPEDPYALARLKRKYGEGLSRSGKIAIAICVPLALLWTLGLVACCYREKIFGCQNGDEDSEDEKGTNDSLSVDKV